MKLYNNYGKKIWIKPENGQSRWLLPSQNANIDGFKPPKWGGNWLKLKGVCSPYEFICDPGKCIITSTGDFKITHYYFGDISYILQNSNSLNYTSTAGRKKNIFSNWKSEPVDINTTATKR